MRWGYKSYVVLAGESLFHTPHALSGADPSAPLQLGLVELHVGLLDQRRTGVALVWAGRSSAHADREHPGSIRAQMLDAQLALRQLQFLRDGRRTGQVGVWLLEPIQS